MLSELSKSSEYLSSVEEDRSKNKNQTFYYKHWSQISRNYFSLFSPASLFLVNIKNLPKFIKAETRLASIIFLLVVVIKNKQMEYMEQNRTQSND